MNDDVYLRKVLIFLNQEFKTENKPIMKILGSKIVICNTEADNFEDYYKSIYSFIDQNVARIRNREMDLHFSVKTKFQERDFTILKPVTG